MENFDRENIDELLEIRQYFPPSKICAIRYIDYIMTGERSYVLTKHIHCMLTKLKTTSTVEAKVVSELFPSTSVTQKHPLKSFDPTVDVALPQQKK